MNEHAADWRAARADMDRPDEEGPVRCRACGAPANFEGEFCDVHGDVDELAMEFMAQDVAPLRVRITEWLAATYGPNPPAGLIDEVEGLVVEADR